MCYYADFYGCFATLKPSLIATLLAGRVHALNEDVAHKPQVYALLGKKLALEDVYRTPSATS